MQFIDTHCHLQFEVFHSDTAECVRRSIDAGVKRIVVPGVSVESSALALQLASRFPDTVSAAIGIHPYELKSAINPYDEVSRLKTFISRSVVAIGECGLDYHPYRLDHADGKKSQQLELFKAQLILAQVHQLPVILHCRNAFDDLFTCLDEVPLSAGGVLHCFSGGLQDIRMAIARNLMIGIDGNLTYDRHLQRILPHIPLDALVFETDSPNLTPHPFRGKRNEPKNLTVIATYAADLLGIDLGTLAAATTRNASTLFRFPASSL